MYRYRISIQDEILHPRAYNRFPMNAGASIIRGDGRIHSVIVKDISVRGAGIFSAYPFSSMEKVEIVLDRPFFTEPVVRPARVVWSERISSGLWQCGLYFLSFPLSFE